MLGFGQHRFSDIGVLVESGAERIHLKKEAKKSRWINLDEMEYKRTSILLWPGRRLKLVPSPSQVRHGVGAFSVCV